MNMKLMCLVCIIGGFLCVGIVNSALAKEDDYPVRPIELVVAFGPGGATELGAKAVADGLSRFIGQPVITVTKAGAGGTIAASYVARSKPDGYTLFNINSGSNAVAPAVQKVRYKNADFDVLAQFGSLILYLVVKGDAPWKTVRELVDYAKKNPGELKYGSSGIGSSGCLANELLKDVGGKLKIDHVPFKSTPEYLAALLGGHIHMVMCSETIIKGLLEAGKLRALAVTADKRIEKFPAVPTFAEEGFPELKFTMWYGVAAPAGLPATVSKKLKEALYKSIQSPEVKKQLINLDYIFTFRDAEEFTKFSRGEEERMRTIVQEAGIKIE